MLAHKELQEIKEQLLRRLRDINEQLGKARESSKPVSLDQPIGRVSRGDALMNQQMAQSNQRSLETQKLKIESALRRIDKNEYGYCLSCGDTMDKKRLDLFPEATLCIDCQKMHERA